MTKVKALFNRCCSSRLAPLTNCWTAGGRGQVELQIGGFEIVVAAAAVVLWSRRVGLWTAVFRGGGAQGGGGMW